jgi:hypothetical protein
MAVASVTIGALLATRSGGDIGALETSGRDEAGARKLFSLYYAI